MCRFLGIPRWSNCSSELARPPPGSKPRPTCPRFRLMVASKERNITFLDSGSLPQPVQLEHGGGWGTAQEVQNCRRCCECHDHKWISWRQKYITEFFIHWLLCFSKNDIVRTCVIVCMRKASQKRFFYRPPVVLTIEPKYGHCLAL